MNKYHFFSIVFFIGAIIFFIIGFLQGDVEGGLFIIFPFISGSGIFALIGIIFIFLAIIFYIFGFVGFNQGYKKYPYEKEESIEKKRSVKGGGVVLIGPIPIVFGSSWKIAVILMVLAIIIIIVSLFAFRIIYF